MPDDQADAVQQRVADLDMEYLGNIPHDDRLATAVFNNQSLLELDASTAVERMERIMNRLVV